jgi:murein DD-endopeptidase MepM/ murein hydrolase activator NlpD
MKSISSAFLLLTLLFLTAACRKSLTSVTADAAPTPAETPAIVAGRFAYSIGKKEVSTQPRDARDDWYNALDFGQENHLGEDWNKNSGGDSDCGETVYAIANGRVVYAENAGEGWGNVVIIDHLVADGRRVQSLYGHLRKIFKAGGEVELRERIGEIGNADGRYLCHLHFEIRTENSPMWNRSGPGYAAENDGWIDPSDFIDQHNQER